MSDITIMREELPPVRRPPRRHLLSIEDLTRDELYARPTRPPEVLVAPLDGMLAVIRAIPPTQPGDSVFTTGQPIEASALL